MLRGVSRDVGRCEVGEGEGNDCEGRERPCRIDFGMVVLML